MSEPVGDIFPSMSIVHVPGFGLWVEVEMRVSASAMFVRVKMVAAGETFADRVNAEPDERQRDEQLECPIEARAHAHAQEDEGAANEKKRQQMTESPECPGERGAPRAAVLARECGHSDDVIAVGGVLQAKSKAEQNGSNH